MDVEASTNPDALEQASGGALRNGMVSTASLHHVFPADVLGF